MDLPNLTNTEWFQEMIRDLELSSEILMGSAIVMIIIGIFGCFFGYPLFRIILGIFAGIAVALATIGIYGLLQYSTTRQTRDIGIRMALGARRADVLRTVLGRGFRLILIGVVVGVVGAVALTRVLSSLLYDVTSTDPLTLALVSCVLAAIALLASFIPARRAAKVDPMTALRYE